MGGNYTGQSYKYTVSINGYAMWFFLLNADFVEMHSSRLMIILSFMYIDESRQVHKCQTQSPKHTPITDALKLPVPVSQGIYNMEYAQALI